MSQQTGAQLTRAGSRDGAGHGGATRMVLSEACLTGLLGHGVYEYSRIPGWCASEDDPRERRVAVLGRDHEAARLAIDLARHGCDVILLTDGPLTDGTMMRHTLRSAGVGICEDPVLGITGEADRYVRLSLIPGWTLERRALFAPPLER